MNKQGIYIIETLIEEHNYITYNCIAKRLNVSLSTVIRSIKSLDSYFTENNIKIDKKRGVGIKLILSEDGRSVIKKSLNTVDRYNLCPNDRKIIIICGLLNMDEPIKSYYFSSVLNVTLGTVSRDLEKVGNWFKGNNLKLIKARGNGLFVEGEEKSIREAIVDLLISSIDNKNNYFWNVDFMKPKFFKENLAQLTKMKLADLIDYKIIVNIIKIVQKYDSNLKEVLVDSSYFQFIIFLSLIIQRKGRNIVIEDYKINNIKKLYQYSYISLLIKEVEKYYEVIVSNNDIYVIMIHFITSGIRKISKSNAQITNDRELSMIANRIIFNLQDNLKVRLDNDDELLARLMIHLKLMLDRQNMDVKVSNNCLDVIKTDYRHIFDVVKKSVDFLKEITQKNTDEEEIGFITIHIVATLLALENDIKIIRAVVVCTSGIGTSKILVEKIKQEIKNIEIVASMSSAAVNEVSLVKKGVDLIISSVNLETFVIPTIIVNPLMKDEDKSKIYKLINQIDKRKSKQLTTEMPGKINVVNDKKSIEDMLFYMEIIHEIMDGFYYEENICSKDENQLIEYVSKQISYSNKMNQIILKEFLKREQYGSTVIDDKGLILLHCKAGSYIKLGVARLKTGIEVSVGKHEENINTALIMIIPEYADDRILDIFTEISTQLIENEVFKEDVINGSKDAILNKLGKLLTKFMT